MQIKSRALLVVCLVCIGGLGYFAYRASIAEKKLAEVSQEKAALLAEIAKRSPADAKGGHSTNQALQNRSENPGAPAEVGVDAVSVARSRKAAAIALDNAQMSIRTQPELQQLYLRRFQVAASLNFAPLFKSLNLSPAAIEKVQQILADRFTALSDLAATGVAKNIPSSDPEFIRALENIANPPDDPLQSVLGQDGLETFRKYKSTYMEDVLVDSLVSKTALTSPLSLQQVAQVAAVLEGNNANNNRKNDWMVAQLFPGIGRTGADWNEIDWNSASGRLEGILTPEQFRILSDVRNEALLRKQAQEIYTRKVTEWKKIQAATARESK